MRRDGTEVRQHTPWQQKAEEAKLARWLQDFSTVRALGTFVLQTSNLAGVCSSKEPPPHLCTCSCAPRWGCLPGVPCAPDQGLSEKRDKTLPDPWKVLFLSPGASPSGGSCVEGDPHTENI